MSLSKILPETKQKEKRIQKKIYTSIDNFKDFIFKAGAGAGKTYSLIESLKYIINEYAENLNHHNQEIMCITYTNVAVNEIKERLGNSDIVKVSTIHERLWELIRNHKKELLKIHEEKIFKEVDKLYLDLNEKQEKKIKKKFEVYRNLDDDLKKSFKKIMISKKDVFYDNYDKKASDFRKIFEECLKAYPKILKNISHFKKIVNTIYKIENYEQCLKGIDMGKEQYKNVIYDSRYNSDILHRMIISHDTLLSYSLKMVIRHDLLKQIIIDKYPYILIDEFQDTNKQVIKIMNIISNYAKKIKHNLFIGYFGDVVQSIYDDGVGGNIKEIHSDLKIINKKYNRRSHKEIIDVINKIRNDGTNQESIYNDCMGGSVDFYTSDDENKTKFIEKYIEEWKINSDNKLHCLVLTNKLMSEFSGFIEIYNCFSKTSYYKKNWDQINNELLSNDLSKLGDVQNLFYNIIKFKSDIDNSKTPLVNLFDESIYSELSFSELKKLIDILKSLDGDSLDEYIKSIFENYNKNIFYQHIINELMNLEKYSYQGFLNKIYSDLDEDYSEDNNKVNNILRIDFSIYRRWYNFINQDHEGNIIFHTYHGTKGAEYKNVIIIMQNDFGTKGKDKFSSFFINYNNTERLEEKANKKFNNTRNLIYVSCSRAIKNLRILYLDDISRFQEEVREIFGEIKKFPTEKV